MRTDTTMALQPLAGPGAAQQPAKAGAAAAAVAVASPRSPAAPAAAAAAGAAPVRRQGHLVLEGLSTPRVAARTRVDAVAVLGAHLALSVRVVDAAPGVEDGVTALLGFAGIAGGEAAEASAGPSLGPTRRQRRRPRAQWEGGHGASDEEQRRFLAGLARGQLSRLAGLSLGEPTRAQTLGLHFFVLDSGSGGRWPKQPAQGEEGAEPRLLAMQADGLVRLWALHGRHGPAWVPLTSFLLPFRHRPLQGVMSFDGSSRRLVYVEAVAAAATDGGPGAGASEEQPRVVSREIVFTTLPQGTDGSDQVVTVGCAVPIAQVAAAQELVAVRAGSRGCWIVTAARVGYNCFETKQLVWMQRRQEQRASGGAKAPSSRVFFALHPITEQLMALDPWDQGGTLSVYSAPGNGTPLTRRVLHRGLLSRCHPGSSSSSPIQPHEVGGFAVHRNLALVSLPGRAQLAAFHLRTGDYWCCLPLLALRQGESPDGEPGRGEDRAPPRFWADRSGSTALGLWWPERGNALLRLVYPSAEEELAFLSTRGPSGLAAAHRLCREHGPSLAHALSHRALDAAHAAVLSLGDGDAFPAAETVGGRDVAGGQADANEDEEEAEEEEKEGDGGRGRRQEEQGPTAYDEMAEIPLVLRAGLVMAASNGRRGESTEPGVGFGEGGSGGGRSSDDDRGAARLAPELRAALRGLDELRSEAMQLAAAPVPRSEKGGRREALTALARRLRRGEDGRFRRVTPLLLVAEPLLREWLQQQDVGTEEVDVDSDGEEAATAQGGDAGGVFGNTPTRSSPILSAVDLAHAVSRASHDRGDLAATWARVLAQEQPEEEQGQQQQQQQQQQEEEGQEDTVLRPLLLYCCALGDDGFLEALAPLLFRLQPARLVHLVARLAEPDMQPLPFQPATDPPAEPPPRPDVYYRARFLAVPPASGAASSGEAPVARTPPRRRGSSDGQRVQGGSGKDGAVPELSTGRRVQEDDDVSPSEAGGARGGGRRAQQSRGSDGLSLNPFDEEREEEMDDEEMEAGVSLSSLPLSMHNQPALLAEEAAEDEGEAQRRASRTLYARALRLLEPPPIGGVRGYGGEEQEAAYRALLEGAGRFVCLARRLVQHQHSGEEGGDWSAALALLDRLRAAPCGRAHHQAFAFLLGQALGAADLGQVEAVMARRPCALTVADLWALARRLRQEEQEQGQEQGQAGGETECGSPRLGMANLKLALSLLLSETSCV